MARKYQSKKAPLLHYEFDDEGNCYRVDDGNISKMDNVKEESVKDSNYFYLKEGDTEPTFKRVQEVAPVSLPTGPSGEEEPEA